MLGSLAKRSLIAVYLSVLRPCFATQYANMSSPTALTEVPSVESSASIQPPGIYSVAYVTVPDMETGKKIAHGLVEKKLAACVNMIPQITSVYEWEGKINEDSEALLMIKTRTEQVNELTDYVKRNHPYKVCEVISLPIQNGNMDYLKWIGDTVPPPKTF